ncbi:MAG: ABC transporter permease [Bacteroidia bacterium]|nr:ABC transporter permease [Bacteroidia bacterium]
MNTELFIARRILSGRDKKSISRPMVRISVAGIILGITVMILTVSIVTGFKQEIRNKITGFGAHIIISNYDSNSSFETVPIPARPDFYQKMKQMAGIRHIQEYALKAGIIKTGGDIQGVLLKGVGSDYDWSFIRDNLKEGKIFSVSEAIRTDQVIISGKMASLLKLKPGDSFTTYFVQQPPRVRKFMVSGIFKSSLEDFDKIMICDISHIQKLNNWTSDQVSGLEVSLSDFDHLDQMTAKIQDLVGTGLNPDGTRLQVEKITGKYPQIFDWIGLIDTNTWIILVLMITVAGFNMISGLLIIILERANMIGILKALGTENWSIRKVFLYNAAFINFKGLVIGNILGISCCMLQQRFGIIKLDPATYYVPVVPVNLKLVHLLLLNAGTILVTVSMMVIPTWLITRISPDKAIRFD